MMTYYCNTCNQPVRVGEFHEDANMCITAAIARAEAAEAEVERLTADNAALRDLPAADGWRPVTEDWPPVGIPLWVNEQYETNTVHSRGRFARRHAEDGFYDPYDGVFFGGEVTHAIVLPQALPVEPRKE